MASASQQSPSRPSSAAPIAKSEKERAKTPGEERMNIRDTDHGSATIQPHPQGALMALPMDSANMLNHAMRAGPPGTAPNPGFMPPQFFNPGMNMNVPSQQAYGPTPPMQFYPPNYNPNAYAQAPNTVRPGSAMAKFQPMDPKFVQAPNQLAHSNAPPQLQNNLPRRPSNYFVAPTMSPVQTSYGRGWIPSNSTMIAGPMPMQNGAQSPAMYQPAMLPTNANPPLLTPPGVQPNYSNTYAPPAAVPNPGYGFPTPPESSGLPPDIPPPVPSVYPDPAYSNINNCIYNPKGTTNVYIRGLRPETTDDDLLHMVRNYGVIISTKAIIDTSTKSCKGFGFAKFESVDQGVACIVALSQAGYQCSFAKESFSNRLKELSEPANTNLYLSNLPLDVDEQRLDDLLKPHRVHSSRILRDQNRVSRGVGFARMTDREAADAVIEQWNGKSYPGSDIPLQVRFADTPMQKKLKNVTARRRSWRAKEYNSLTQGRPMSPETQRYYDEQFSQGTMDYPAGQLYQNDGSWQQDAFNGYTINGLEPSQGLGHL